MRLFLTQQKEILALNSEWKEKKVEKKKPKVEKKVSTAPKKAAPKKTEEKESLLGITTKKDEDFAKWYSPQTLKKHHHHSLALWTLMQVQGGNHSR